MTKNEFPITGRTIFFKIVSISTIKAYRKQGRKSDAATSDEKPEMFVTTLGVLTNKIEIIRDNGNSKFKPKEWIDRKAWRE